MGLYAWKGAWTSVRELIAVLETVPSGMRAVEQARARDPAFLQSIVPAGNSVTESTLSRSYSLEDGKENFELRNVVYLQKDMSLADAVVDLAHELTHYAHKEFQNPYEEGFERKSFVRAGIEGPGGELDAFAEECEVAWELSARYAGFPEHSLCRNYKDKDGRFKREEARKDYYAVGAWAKSDSARELGYPELSERAPVFRSSYTRSSYPEALSKEFFQTKESACSNNRRKFLLIQASQQGKGRAPAALSALANRLKAYDASVCRNP